MNLVRQTLMQFGTMLFNDAICQPISFHSLKCNLLPPYSMMPFVICQEGNVLQHDLNEMMLFNMT